MTTTELDAYVTECKRLARQEGWTGPWTLQVGDLDSLVDELGRKLTAEEGTYLVRQPEFLFMIRHQRGRRMTETLLTDRERSWAANQFGSGCRTLEDVERADAAMQVRLQAARDRAVGPHICEGEHRCKFCERRMRPRASADLRIEGR